MKALKRVKNKYNLVVFTIFATLILLLFLYATYKSRGLIKSPPTGLPPSATPIVNQAKEEIILENPTQGETVSSPLRISGRASGSWFFEATFPIVLTDWDGNIIAESFATAEGEWMTEEFVPFTATLNFVKPVYGENGSLILQKANPSGLPENAKALKIAVFFK